LAKIPSKRETSPCLKLTRVKRLSVSIAGLSGGAEDLVLTY
jgi:hypothetical protein